ncbi:hypothetical protein GMDG_06992 [Pseudogymnoascus destructans 20631-21]|uniref:DUF7918 domain-containing protein n=1 Tax=Pseudogymnoascus destructans (strain ATCC MYA-4855 / 20631-21) TaxID=658429 RepID=L8FW46_PSED2|nr:hypothetical protein GMDG_06992 [Pseudogymnoascus destructans 20631-21]
MAILPSFPGISVTVHNAQGQLPEYADVEPNIVEGLQSPLSVVTSNYIEVPPDGGPFWLNFYVRSDYMHAPHGVMFGFEDPGADIRNWMSYTSNWSNDNKWLRGASEGYAGGNERNPLVRTFKFDKLKILSGDGESDGLSLTERKKMESMGMFQIRIIPGKPDEARASQWTQGLKQANRPVKFSDSITDTAHAMATITEKVAARKSLSLGIGYTDKILNPPAIPVAHTSYHTYNNIWNHPIAIFQFRYRSRADLQRLLLIKAAPQSEQIPRGGSRPGWRLAIHITAALTILLGLVNTWSLPNDTRKESSSWSSFYRSVDWIGLTISKHPVNIVLLCLAALLIPMFAFWMNLQEKHGRPALVPNSMWRNKAFTCMCLMVVLIWATLQCMRMFLSLFFQNIQHFSALNAAVLLFPNVIAGIALNLLTGFLACHVSSYYLVLTANVFGILSPLLLCIINPAWNYWICSFWAVLLSPVSAGVVFTIANLVITDAFPKKTQALAGAMSNTAQQLGGAFGLALAGVVAARGSREDKTGVKMHCG